MKTIWERLAEKYPQEKQLIEKYKLDIQGLFTGASHNFVLDLNPRQILQKEENRNQCVITADPANTDLLYLGFDITVSIANYFAVLEPGSEITMDNFKGELWVISPTTGQKIGAGEW